MNTTTTKQSPEPRTSDPDLGYSVCVCSPLARVWVLRCRHRQVLEVRSVDASGVGLTAGSAANLIAVDAQRLMDTAGSLHELWGLPLQVKAFAASADTTTRRVLKRTDYRALCMRFVYFVFEEHGSEYPMKARLLRQVSRLLRGGEIDLNGQK